MIPEIEFYRPQSLEELLIFLKENLSAAKIIAGGTDIIPGLRQKASRFRHIQKLADIHNLKELKAIKLKDEYLSIGACARFSQIMENPLIREYFPLIATAASLIGSTQIRNRATIAGNFVNNAPCADSVPPLLVYDAQISIQSHQHAYSIPLKDIFLKAYQTLIKPDEVVTEIRLPFLKNDYWGEFYKLGRRRGVAISRISFAILMHLQSEIIQDIRIASGAITPISVRLAEIEEAARNQKASSELFRQLAQQLGNEIEKITGTRWSTSYKLPVVQHMFYQTLLKLTY